MDEEPRRTRFGPYVLFGDLGHGGMGAVHLARGQSAFGVSRPVALKLMHERLLESKEAIRRFVDEARLAARIQHPNVVRILDAGVDESTIFIAMEYVHGASLDVLMRNARLSDFRIPVAVSVCMIQQALLGLHAAHEVEDASGERLQLIHRDVSPQNILVSVAGTTLITDFGVAYARNRLHETPADQLVGKIVYAAPEHLIGAAAGSESDVFSAGVVLWELLTERSAYRTAEARTLALVERAALPPPSKFRPEVSPDLDAVVMRMLAFERSDRYATAEAAAVALAKASPVASATEVAELLKTLAADVLWERNAFLAAAREESPLPEAVAALVETRGAERPRTSRQAVKAPSTEPARSPSPARNKRTVVAVLLVVAASATFLGIRGGTNRAPRPEIDADVSQLVATASPSADGSTATAMPTTGLVASSTGVESVSPPDPKTGVEDAGNAAARPSQKARPQRRDGGAVKARSCDPPSYVDAKGILRYYPECVKE